MKYILLAILIVGILFVGGFIGFGGEAPTVSAQGTAVEYAEPDEVSVYLQIEVRNTSAQIAQNELERISDSVVLEMLRIGIEKSQIQLVGYSIYPEYDWSDGKQTQKGYIAQQQVIIETDDFDSVAEIVDSAVEAGALVSTINFELSEELQNEYKVIVLKEAGQDARTKAEAIAAGVGKNIGRLVSVRSEDFYYPGPIVYYEKAAVTEAEGAADARQAAVSLTPRDIEVRATIAVEYSLSRF